MKKGDYEDDVGARKIPLKWVAIEGGEWKWLKTLPNKG